MKNQNKETKRENGVKTTKDVRGMEMASSKNNVEYLELKGLLLQLQSMLLTLIPAKASISYLVETTGKSRQAIRKYLYAHFEPDVDFWVENAKIFTTKETAAHIISRGAK